MPIMPHFWAHADNGGSGAKYRPASHQHRWRHQQHSQPQCGANTVGLRCTIVYQHRWRQQTQCGANTVGLQCTSLPAQMETSDTMWSEYSRFTVQSTSRATVADTAITCLKHQIPYT